MSLEKFGDWNIAMNLAANMEKDIKHSNRVALMQLASRAEAMAVKFMRDQTLPWKKLSEKYLERKERQGLSDKILIATSTYFQSITSIINSTGTKSFAGVMRKQKNKEGQYVSDIAKVLEYGSIKRGIPPRKFWTVVYRDMRKFLIAEKIFAAEAVKAMKNRTGGKG
jgi:hypothetical protein